MISVARCVRQTINPKSVPIIYESNNVLYFGHMTLDVQFIEKRNEKENITELLASEWINNHKF